MAYDILVKYERCRDDGSHDERLVNTAKHAMAQEFFRIFLYLNNSLSTSNFNVLSTRSLVAGIVGSYVSTGHTRRAGRIVRMMNHSLVEAFKHKKEEQKSLELR